MKEQLSQNVCQRNFRFKFFSIMPKISTDQKNFKTFLLKFNFHEQFTGILTLYFSLLSLLFLKLIFQQLGDYSALHLFQHSTQPCPKSPLLTRYSLFPIVQAFPQEMHKVFFRPPPSKHIANGNLKSVPRIQNLFLLSLC